MERMKGGQRGSEWMHCLDALCLHNHIHGSTDQRRSYYVDANITLKSILADRDAQIKVLGRECFMLQLPRFSLFLLFFFFLPCYLRTIVI